MLFKLDENLPRTAARVLREHGHDALSALDQKMGGRPDAQLLEAAKLENRAFITLDLHFSDIRTHPPQPFPASSSCDRPDKTCGLWFHFCETCSLSWNASSLPGDYGLWTSNVFEFEEADDVHVVDQRFFADEK